MLFVNNEKLIYIKGSVWKVNGSFEHGVCKSGQAVVTLHGTLSLLPDACTAAVLLSIA
jgi:hypothetical protein